MILICEKLKQVFGIHNNQIYSFVQISVQNSVAYITHFRLKMEIVASDFKDLATHFLSPI